jgi:hypothetical protein
VRVWRNPLSLAIAAAAMLVVAPALADKPASVLSHAEPVAITAIPIDFDRDNPEHKEFGKLVWRGGVNRSASPPILAATRRSPSTPRAIRCLRSPMPEPGFGQLSTMTDGRSKA